MLRYREDRRSVAVASGYLAVVGVCLWLGAARWQLALTPVLCVWCFSIATICHNSQHCPVFRSKRLNRAWHVLLTLGAGEPVTNYIAGHNLSHHVHLQRERDPMRTSKARYRSNLANYLLFFLLSSGALSKVAYGYLWRSRKLRPHIFRQFVLEATALLIGYGLAIWVDWKVFLMLVLVPHQFAGWAIFSVNYPQHDGCDPDHPVNHSRNFVGAVDNWLFFNNGYHGIHHMKPGVHWSRYPQLHQELVAPTIHPNLEQPSLLGYLWRSAVWPGKRLTYDGQPVVLGDPLQDISFEQPADTAAVASEHLPAPPGEPDHVR